MDLNAEDEIFMQAALEQARLAALDGEVPVGAVVVKDGEIISVGRNRREIGKNALAHAELEAIDGACRALGGWRLWQCDLYVTLEPCPMCTGAIINSRIRRLVYGASDRKAGSCGSVVNLFDLPYNHRPEMIAGCMGEECGELLRRFFRDLRQRKKNRELHLETVTVKEVLKVEEIRFEKEVMGILREIVNMIAERRYAEIPKIVCLADDWNAELIKEMAEGFLEANELTYFDKFGVECNCKNINYKQLLIIPYKDGRGFHVDYDLTTDSEPNDLTLQMEFLYADDGIEGHFLDLHVM